MLIQRASEEKELILNNAYQELKNIELKRLTIIQNIEIYKEKLNFILKEQEKYLKEIDIITKESE